MRATVSRVVAGCLLPLWLISTALADDGADQSLAESFPSGAVIFAEADGLGAVVDRFRNSEFLEQILLSPQYKAAEERPDFERARDGLIGIEAVLGNDLWTTFEKILGERWAIAVYPGDVPEQPHVAARIDVSDAEFLAETHARLQEFLGLAPDRVERFETDDGEEGYTLDGRLSVVFEELSVFAATTRDMLDELRMNGGDEVADGTSSLAGDERLVAMTEHLGEDHHFRLYADTHAISQASGGRMGIPEKVDNPLGSLLLSGLLELAAGSPYLGVTADVNETEFSVVAGVEGNGHDLAETHHVFFSSPDEAGAAPVPQVDGLIGGVTLYRDIAGWYRQRESYLVPEALPGFDQFETNIGNLLPGRDIGEDVLPLLGDRITLLAALQTYDHLGGEPGVKLPGFAAIVELAEPQEGADTMRLFFQTLTAVLNLQAGQQGREPWVMDSESYGETQIVFARYLNTPDGDSLPIAFNFQPTSAHVGDRFLITSSVELCRALIDELQESEQATESENRNFELEVHADSAADALELNRGLIEARAIQAGGDTAQAGVEFDALLEMVRSLDSLRLTTSAGEDTFELRLQGAWK